MHSTDIKIISLDKLTYAGNIDNLEGTKGVKMLPGDIAHVEDSVFELIRPEIIVNFAAETHVDRSIRDPKAFLQTDVMGLFNLVYLAKRYGVKMNPKVPMTTQEWA